MIPKRETKVKSAAKIKSSKGFTLLEVMVALSIFAICAAILLEQSGLSTRQSAHLENKTLAIWIAQNKLDALRLQPQWPTIKTSSERVEQAKRTWQVSTEISATTNEKLRKVTVAVALGEDSEHSIAQLTGFIGEH